MPFSLIPFMLLIIPMLEIATFVVVGGQIGVFPTLAMIVVTAIIGSILLRVQGFGLIAKIQSDISRGKMPARELVHGVMIAIAGILLLTPGFVTDTCGFLLFVPPIRDAVWHFAKSRINIVNLRGGPDQSPTKGDASSGPTIDLDEDDFKREPDANSPWSDK
ncbi:FxsA family protein [Ahrensia kielensis]|uniref:FxsA family protein n=1 Tax=Ahrensia kielensis TaxID=76980 RepID=UPI000399938D|nr:FxsA family protein [Ahrensia kielensis]